MAVQRSVRTVFRTAAAGVAALPAAAMAAPGGVLALGALQFGAPWMLAGLAALPPLWWLMRSIPPKPAQVDFPAINILLGLKNEDQQPAKMPWWQYLLRTAAAAAVIIGLAQPEWNPETPLQGKGPVMLVVDNGWAAGRNWDTRVAELEHLVGRAERAGRPLIILPTAPTGDSASPLRGPVNAEEARSVLKTIKPQPVPADHQAAMNTVKAMAVVPESSVVWLSDGLGSVATPGLAEQLRRHGPVSVLEDHADKAPRLLAAAEGKDDMLTLTLRRLQGEKAEEVWLSAHDGKGSLKRQAARFDAGQTEITVTFNLPAEIRAQLTKVTVDGDSSAGSVVLLDERWRRRPVALIASNTAESTMTLLGEQGYIAESLKPFTDLHMGDVDSAMKDKMAVIIVGDNTIMNAQDSKKIDDWAREGGMLLRFSGPNMAQRENKKDTLLPMGLRPGSRAVSGALSGSGTGRIAPFEKTSPFYGIKVPGNVTVERQVLPGADAAADVQTWASLEDGSPLVTARPHGKGWVVLFHTTANSEWSNLALSGLFMDMLRGVVAQSRGVDRNGTGPAAAMPPVKVLDGYGQLVAPPPEVQSLSTEIFRAGRMDAKHPPGIYGNESVRQAYNLAVAVPALRPLPPLPDGAVRRTYSAGRGSADLAGWALGGAMSLMLLDLLILLAQRGATGRKAPLKPAPAP